MNRELNDGVKRTVTKWNADCSWCGQKRRVLFVYRYPGALDYRIPARYSEPAFCAKQCSENYHA